MKSRTVSGIQRMLDGTKSICSRKANREAGFVEDSVAAFADNLLFKGLPLVEALTVALTG